MSCGGGEGGGGGAASGGDCASASSAAALASFSKLASSVTSTPGIVLSSSMGSTLDVVDSRPFALSEFTASVSAASSTSAELKRSSTSYWEATSLRPDDDVWVATHAPRLDLTPALSYACAHASSGEAAWTGWANFSFFTLLPPMAAAASRSAFFFCIGSVMPAFIFFALSSACRFLDSAGAGAGLLPLLLLLPLSTFPEPEGVHLLAAPGCLVVPAGHFTQSEPSW
mmetsp:Transcript_14413/g.58771  ORF Transcript_14413/g.58771 Transcript_14413/m.58771 type:complete len:227 (-) Transcript_14413:1034-1714(-)